MAVTEIRKLSPHDMKNAILKISKFVLREPSASIRDSLYRRMLEIGVYLSEQNAQEGGLVEILKLIESQFFGVRLETEIAEKYMKQLQEEGIVKTEGRRYLLREENKSQIENYSKDALALVSSCETDFIEDVKEKSAIDIPTEEIEKLKNCFYQFIVQLISRYVVTTAKLFVEGTLTSIPQVVGERLVDQSTKQIGDKQLRKAAVETLLKWMQSPDYVFVEYLFFMRQNFLCIEVLNLDPDCRMLEKEEFSKKWLFLDTNVLLPLIVESELHKQTKKLIENTKQLGCSIYVTERTLGEFNILLEKTKKTLEMAKATPYQLSKATSIFIRNYGRNLLSGKSMSPAEYIDQFSDVKGLLGAMGVNIFGEEHIEIKEHPEYNSLVEEVQKCFLRLRWRMKTADVAEHDAYHLLLVKTLRKTDSDSILGPNKWFLTYDLTLPSADSFIRRKFDFSDRTMATMIVDVWNEIISPFLIGIVPQKDLVEVLKSFVSSEFTPISEGIDVETLARLEVDWTEYDWLETKEIQNITRQEFVLNYISRAEQLAKTGDSEALERLRSEFNLAFSRLIGQISNRKIEQVRTKLEERERETEQLKVSVADLEKTRSELQVNLNSEHNARMHILKLSLRMRYVAGIIGAGLLLIGVMLIVMMKETATWQITSLYLAFLVLGAILLLMAIKPEQVSGVIGLGQKK
jgi:predicted nucleic-acid-binding protein